ncbi:MAG: DUF4388 domain-containing protein [Sandaracinaceae bacterium]|nr:DUF4388 domain-containing protein [Sandaracinaceae bacterium]
MLQWLDARGSRALVVVRATDGREAWLVADRRFVVAGSPPLARGRLATDGTPGAPGPGLRALAREYLLDLFLTPTGSFELDEQAAPPTVGVELEIPVQFLVMEGLRLLDEWPRIEETYPRDEARLAATDTELPELNAIDSIDAAICAIALDAPALGEARLVLGLSRPALLRRVDALRQRGLVEVEGIPHGPDVEGSLVENARKLLAARQYAEAAHVFRALLTTNPADVRLRQLLAEAERLQCQAVYERFGRTDVVTLVGDPRAHKLVAADLAVVEALARPRAVGVLVLASPLRELETLLALTRLSTRGLVAIESAE